MRPAAVFVAILAACSSTGGRAQEKPTALKGARIITMAGKIIPEGTILFHKGKIVAVGSEVKLPPDTVTVDARGKTVVPGLVAAGSVVPAPGGANEETSEVTPDFRVHRSLDSYHRELRNLVARGVTTAYAGPGPRNVVSGFGIAVHPGQHGRAFFAAGASSMLAITLGSEPSDGNWAWPGGFRFRRPTTRMGVDWLLRKSFADARTFARTGSLKGLAKEVPGPYRRAELQVLVDALAGKARVRIKADQLQDVWAAVRLIKKYKLAAVIEGAGEFLPALRALEGGVVRGVILDTTPRQAIGSYWAPADSRFVYGASRFLERAGLIFALRGRRFAGALDLLATAAVELRHGLSERRALEAITIHAARILGLEKEAGSIEPGKRADLVLLSGKPFDLATRVESVYSAGRPVFPFPNHDNS